MRTTLAVLLLCSPLIACAQDSARGVVPIGTAPTRGERPGPFDARQSAALFVGVRDFSDPGLLPVRYSVDDAVDLAYAMAFDRKVRLVPPGRIVLAISSEPEKAESRQKLQRLRDARAVVTDATRDTIAAQLARQSALAERDGLLILFFASHGFSDEGTPYVLASTSRFDDPASSLSAVKIYDAATRSRARRALILIDACRERVPARARGPYYTAGGAAPMIETMTPLDGQVLFYAAAPNGYAYEDDGNGVFTRAVLDGLTACRAGTQKGLVTVETLARHVESEVRAWVRRRRDSTVRKAIQVVMDPDTKSMPLAMCSEPPRVASLQAAGTSLTAYDEDGAELWTANVAAEITATKIVDLDDDRFAEVLIGDREGTLTLFTAEGGVGWVQKTAERMSVDTIAADYLAGRKHHRHIVALSNAPDGSEGVLTIVTSDGTPLARHSHPARLLGAVIDKLTARHQAKIIAGSASGLFMLDRDGVQEWLVTLAAEGQRVEGVGTIDIDNDRRRDIEVRTDAGTLYLTFDGKMIRSDGPKPVPIAVR